VTDNNKAKGKLSKQNYSVLKARPIICITSKSFSVFLKSWQAILKLPISEDVKTANTFYSITHKV